MRTIVLIAHNMRSCHNVGSLLRTCEGLGVQAVYLTGYTPYPLAQGDTRLPHIAAKMTKQIAKTALDAQDLQEWHHADDVFTVIANLKHQGFTIVGLEQTSTSVILPTYKSPHKIAIITGREVEGMEPDVLAACDSSVVIPMFGQKESFNVVQASAMALYQFRFSPE